MTDWQVPTNWADAPFTSGSLDVGGSHVLYWCCFGKADAIPVVTLHGGPGSGSNPQHLTFFDPQVHRIVMFDQRGTGQSKASIVTVDNTTQDLIADIEALRRYLRVECWLVFGMSWGACLALLYSQRHPRSCSALVLVGLSNRHDHQTSWILDKRARLLPDRHEAFLMTLSARDRKEPVTSLYRKSLSVNRRHQLEATYAVWLLEAGLEGPDPEPLSTMALDQITPSMVSRAKIYLHYWANKTFLSEGHLLINSVAIKDVPLTLIHGASDWVCPLSGAEQVACELENAQLVVVPGMGHTPYGTGPTQTIRALMGNAKGE